jgi:hypothetical protein
MGGRAIGLVQSRSQPKFINCCNSSETLSHVQGVNVIVGKCYIRVVVFVCSIFPVEVLIAMSSAALASSGSTISREIGR